MTDDNTSMTSQLKLARESGAPEYYLNGFTAAVGSSDIVVLLERNNSSVAVLNLSFTSAKSLSVVLGLLIAQIEERSDRNIMTSEDIDNLFAQSEPAGNTHELGNNKKVRRPNKDPKKVN